jgi:hypothetical protein
MSLTRKFGFNIFRVIASVAHGRANAYFVFTV